MHARVGMQWLGQFPNRLFTPNFKLIHYSGGLLAGYPARENWYIHTYSNEKGCFDRSQTFGNNFLGNLKLILLVRNLRQNKLLHLNTYHLRTRITSLIYYVKKYIDRLIETIAICSPCHWWWWIFYLYSYFKTRSTTSTFDIMGKICENYNLGPNERNLIEAFGLILFLAT